MYWYRHYRDTENPTPRLESLIANLFDRQQSFATWVRLHDMDRPGGPFINFSRRLDTIATPVYYASLLGLDWVLSKLINREEPAGTTVSVMLDVSSRVISKPTNTEGQRYVDALQAASDGGHDRPVQTLLEKGADVNDLRREHPALFSRFDECRQGIIASISSQGPSTDTKIDLENPNEVKGDNDATEMCNILADIKQQPNFKDFYRPIIAAEMQSLATTGPVVVLVGSSLQVYVVVVRQEGMEAVDLSSEAVQESPFWKADFLAMCSQELNHILGRALVQLDFPS
ncbi:MAG: hypothetical protein Q9194_007732, partial [Teloschistes cf. exilis]